jgi:RimJ/RimL family protein N-acetyltransferase
MKNPYLIGPTLYLRPVERADAPLLLSWVNNPEVTRTILHRPPINLPAEEEYIDRVTRSEHDLVLLIVLKESDRPVGATGLHQIDFRNRHASFGILLGEPSEWGKGHGTEATRLIVGHAFETLNLNRLWLQVYEYNERGLRCYERVGFREEGRLRQDNFREGRYWDTLVMGILRSEWERNLTTEAQRHRDENTEKTEGK